MGGIEVKFMSSVSFFLSGILLYFVVQDVEGNEDSAQVVLPIVTLLILLIMATLFVSVFFETDTGIARLLVEEAPGAYHTQFPGMPSVDTMFEFILISSAGLAVMFKCIKLKSILKWLGVVIIVGGVVALIGYLLNNPFLYFEWRNFSNPIPPASAMLFVICGVTLVLVSREIKKAAVA